MIHGYGGQIKIKEWELGVSNKVTVPNDSIIKVSQMVMGQFGTMLDGPRCGQQVMLFQDGWIGFLASGTLFPAGSCDHRVKLENKFTIESI